MFNFNKIMQNHLHKQNEVHSVFELIIYFSKTHIVISTIKAKDLQEAKTIAYKKFNHKTIEKIELYSSVKALLVRNSTNTSVTKTSNLA